MKKRFFLPAFLAGLLIATFSMAQSGSTNKIRRQPVDANYPGALQKQDEKFLPDKKNSTSRIIENLGNPEGTVVIDGQATLEQAKDALVNYRQFVFTPDYAEIPVEKGKSIYRIPVINNSPHYKLNDPYIKEQLQAIVPECVAATGEVPHSIQLRHNMADQCCAFFCYSSASQLHRGYYYIGRLNAGCVWHHIIKEGTIYASLPKD